VHVDRLILARIHDLKKLRDGRRRRRLVCGHREGDVLHAKALDERLGVCVGVVTPQVDDRPYPESSQPGVGVIRWSGAPEVVRIDAREIPDADRRQVGLLRTGCLALACESPMRGSERENQKRCCG
jgi:hypothetical protein